MSRRIGTLRRPAALAAWIVTIVVRICLWPALQVVRGLQVVAHPEPAPAMVHRSSDDLRVDLSRALESLPESAREVILLRDFEELTIREMAERLSLSRAATKSRLHRARRLVREYLMEDESAR